MCDVIQLSNSLCPDAPEVGGRHPTGATVHDHSQLDSVVRRSPSCSLDEEERMAMFIWELSFLIGWLIKEKLAVQIYESVSESMNLQFIVFDESK